MLSLTSEQIEKALDALKNGQVIVFPTETSYGLGCDATNARAVERIFKIKGRDFGKALPVIIPDQASASKYVVLTRAGKELAQLFWPGPLNIVAPIAKGSPIASACAQAGTQSVRVSSHPFLATLAHRFGQPIVATSANLSGSDAIYRVKDIYKTFASRTERPDVFIDGGDLPILPASTSVRLKNDKHVEILRQGTVVIPEKFL